MRHQACRSFEGLDASIGIHPHEAALATEDDFRLLAELAKHSAVIAWGEIGLDFHYDHSPRDVQREVFARQLRLAAEQRLPVIIHTREAEDDTLKLLHENWGRPQIGGILHCYSGSLALAQAGLEMGFWVSFSGMLTFPKAHNVREVAQKVPMEQLLIETDAPFLAPVPHRGKRNEPSFVVETAKALAQLKGTSIEVIGRQTSENYRRLFNQASLCLSLRGTQQFSKPQPVLPCKVSANLPLPKKLLLALTAGLLNWAVFPKVGLWPLVWICQVPLMLASFRETSTSRSLLFGFTAGLVFFFGTCHWIAGVLLNYGGLPWIGAELLFLLLALYLSSFYALFSWAFARLSLVAPSLCFWLAPALWVSTEYLRAQVLTGFPWCLLGYGLVDAVNLAQIAKWSGVYGLSFAAISVSAFVAEVLVRPSRSAVLRFGSVASYSWSDAGGLVGSEEGLVKPTHLVRIVQTNIDLDQKLDAVTKSSLLDELAKLSIPSEPRQVEHSDRIWSASFFGRNSGGVLL